MVAALKLVEDDRPHLIKRQSLDDSASCVFGEERKSLKQRLAGDGCHGVGECKA